MTFRLDNARLYRTADAGASGGGGSAPAAAAPVTPPVAEPPAQAPKTYEAEYKAAQDRLAALEAENKKFKDAQLTDQQKLEQRAKDAETALTERDTALQQERVERGIERESRRLGIVDDDAAVRLLDHSRIAFDDRGRPTNLEALLTELVAAKPYLAGQRPDGAAPPPSAGSAANPARPPSVAGTFKESQIADRAFYLANKDAIMKAMREGRVLAGQ